jgi:hypothetical protein
MSDVFTDKLKFRDKAKGNIYTHIYLFIYLFIYLYFYIYGCIESIKYQRP